QVVRGQWMALRRIFGVPVLVLLGAQVVFALLRMGTFRRLGVSGAGDSFSLASYVVTALASAGIMLGDLLALGWVGMWMGLRSRTVNLGTLKTIVFVLIIPWFAGAFLSGIVAMLVAVRSGLMSGGGFASFLLVQQLFYAVF